MATKQGGTKAGFHFLESFKSCKRKFFFHTVLGLEPQKKPFQLIFGGCFHHGKAVFYETKSEKKALAAYAQALAEAKGQIEEEGKYFPLLKTRGPVMLSKWIDRFGKNDLAIYKILAVEKTGSFLLPNGYRMTYKADVVVEGPGGIHIFDTKTSWYSPYLQSEQVEVGDQASTYLYGWNQNNPKKKARGLVPDCIYWNINSEDPDKITCLRAVLVSRSDRDLNEWARGAMSDLADMASRIKAFEKLGIAETFPRTTSYCLSYNRKCEYLDICRQKIKGIPGGFDRVKWTGQEKLLTAFQKGRGK